MPVETLSGNPEKRTTGLILQGLVSFHFQLRLLFTTIQYISASSSFNLKQKHHTSFWTSPGAFYKTRIWTLREGFPVNFLLYPCFLDVFWSSVCDCVRRCHPVQFFVLPVCRPLDPVFLLRSMIRVFHNHITVHRFSSNFRSGHVDFEKSKYFKCRSIYTGQVLPFFVYNILTYLSFLISYCIILKRAIRLVFNLVNRKFAASMSFAVNPA